MVWREGQIRSLTLPASRSYRDNAGKSKYSVEEVSKTSISRLVPHLSVPSVPEPRPSEAGWLAFGLAFVTALGYLLSHGVAGVVIRTAAAIREISESFQDEVFSTEVARYDDL